MAREHGWMLVGVTFTLLVFKIQRHPGPTTARSAYLHEMRVTLELHEGSEEDVQALDNVVVHRNIHHRAHLTRHAGERIRTISRIAPPRLGTFGTLRL